MAADQLGAHSQFLSTARWRCQASLRHTPRAPQAAGGLCAAWGWHSGLLYRCYESVGTRSVVPQQMNQQLVSVERNDLSRHITCGTPVTEIPGPPVCFQQLQEELRTVRNLSPCPLSGAGKQARERVASALSHSKQDTPMH